MLARSMRSRPRDASTPPTPCGRLALARWWLIRSEPFEMLATERVVEIAEGGTRLSVSSGALEVTRDGLQLAAIPLSDIAVVLVSHPAVTLTQAVLTGLAESGAAFVACDERRHPAAMLLPLHGHYVQGERIALQVEAPKPRLNRIWQQVVRAKIRAQARLLSDLHGSDQGLGTLVARVKSADRANVEAQAARRYWPLLFDNPDFRRERDAADQNRLLNYGYAVLRSVVARGICAAGLHPSIGIHHHNRYDAFRLADDLMEPLRPKVDREVAIIVAEHGGGVEMGGSAKARLVEAALGEVVLDGDTRSMPDAVSRMSTSLVDVLAGERRAIAIPEV
ncbi:MAG: type II CRISPR-associated endonuclease Cas1 [Acidobacteria bacterium]|nr:MAG: type II CRISPR-associated endonuclease Cas1 [Acidobacteriota bacterium]